MKLGLYIMPYFKIIRRKLFYLQNIPYIRSKSKK